MDIMNSEHDLQQYSFYLLNFESYVEILKTKAEKVK